MPASQFAKPVWSDAQNGSRVGAGDKPIHHSTYHDLNLNLSVGAGAMGSQNGTMGSPSDNMGSNPYSRNTGNPNGSMGYGNMGSPNGNMGYGNTGNSPCGGNIESLHNDNMSSPFGSPRGGSNMESPFGNMGSPRVGNNLENPYGNTGSPRGGNNMENPFGNTASPRGGNNMESPLPTPGRGGRVQIHSSYARQQAAPCSPQAQMMQNGNSNNSAAAPAPNYQRIANTFNANFNKDRGSGGGSYEKRPSPPPSPVSRAKVALGRAQKEISEVNNFVEEEQDRHRLPGAWKNMGTPPVSDGKSFQRQQKAQYRLELERQIHANKLRRAEEERKLKDSNDHPLGPAYAHPAPSYYNNSVAHRNLGGSDQGEPVQPSPQAHEAAAFTQYIKEKYALDVPPVLLKNSPTSTPGHFQEPGVGYGGGGSVSGTQGRIAPALQKTKKERALTNLMKSRMHPRGVQGNTSRLLSMNQVQPGTRVQSRNEMMMTQQGSPSTFPLPQQQQQQQQPQAGVGHANVNKAQQQQQPGFPPQYTYPPQSRPYGMTPGGWPMQPHPAYAQYYGAFAQPYYSNVSQGQINSSQSAKTTSAATASYAQSQPQPSQPLLQSVTAESYTSPYDYSRRSKGNGSDDDDDDDVIVSDPEFEALKEKTNKPLRIWQTSDELPDPGLRTAVYKAELRKQIDEDRRRKEERLAREREEDERIERKIKEFHEEERRRIALEQQTRMELEERYLNKKGGKNKNEKRKRHQALTIVQNPHPHHPQHPVERQDVDRGRPRSRSSILAEKLAQFGQDEVDSEEMAEVDDPFYFNFADHTDEFSSPDVNEFSQNTRHDISQLGSKINNGTQPVRTASPPVPVVQKKLIDKYFGRDGSSGDAKPQRQMVPKGQDFLYQLKSKLSSERDLVERRLQEKLESTHKNMSLLKFTMSQNKLLH